MLLNRLRRFLESLPEPASWSGWVRFVIVQTGNCRTFTSQCVQNSNNYDQNRRRSTTGRISSLKTPCGESSALARVRSWSRAAYAHLIIVSALYLYDLIKYRLLASITHDFDYLDCLIPGRFRFVGRTNKISGEIVSTFLFWFLVYRWTIHLCVPKFKFFPLEFLMSSRQEVASTEYRPQLLVLPGAHPIIGRPDAGGGGQRRIDGHHDGHESHVVVVNSIFYLKSPFDAQVSRWILRPNRTSKNWFALNLCTKFLFYYSLMLLVYWFLLLYWALGGSVLTNLGFEMSYPLCASWLRNRQSIAQSPSSSSSSQTPVNINNYSHIYLAPKVLAYEIRIDDIPARIPLDYQLFARANLYSLGRIAMDVLENHLFYLEYVLLFIAQFYILVIHSLDVMLNSMEIKARLVNLIEKLETRRDIKGQQETVRAGYCAKFMVANIYHNFDSAHLSPSDISYNPTFCGRNQQRNYQAAAEEEEEEQVYLQNQIADLQAILADHFDNLTRGYNLYIAFFVYFLSVCWFSYTVVICTWMSSIRSRAVEWEFLIAESGATLISLSLMSGIALVRSQNLKLYPLITRAMALDSDFAETKPNWMIILKYYHPRPIYCFAIFDSTEISFLLCIKLLSWIISAFVILANFFYMNKH